jgi:hypothetical protein
VVGTGGAAAEPPRVGRRARRPAPGSGRQSAPIAIASLSGSSIGASMSAE